MIFLVVDYFTNPAEDPSRPNYGDRNGYDNLNENGNGNGNGNGNVWQIFDINYNLMNLLKIVVIFNTSRYLSEGVARQVNIFLIFIYTFGCI